ncbi:LysM peptidoglycan-binding domain-containing protein [bacterium]|nr:LysM peptidoglycan-binding domain-containing protein [bacterium]
MKVKEILTLSLVAALLLAATGLYAQDERKIKMDEYKAQLAETQAREAAASEKAAQLKAENTDLENQIAEVQGQIDAEWEEVYALLGTDKASVEAYRAELAGMEEQLDGLAALSPEEIFQRKDEIKEIEAKIAEMKESNIAMLTEMQNKFAELEAKIAALRDKMPKNMFDQYTVVKGDYLWKISKMEDIYGDPYQWIRIYCSNKDQIKNPDVIKPEQVLNIARGVGENEYLVVKGDWLSKIAETVLNDPAKWTKIYEANKDGVFSEANLIFPHQVLVIPQ